MKTTAKAALFRVRPAAKLYLFYSILLFAGLQLLSGFVFAQSAKPAIAASAPLAKTALAAPVRAVSSKPSWADLTPMQKMSLQPLAASWTTLSEAQKRKWLEISKNYPKLPPEGQAKIHSRMNEWVALSPQQRSEARLNFAKTEELSRQLTPEEKNAKWQTYQALSPEEKQKLASKATPRPTGAAPALKPVSPQKLTAVQPRDSKSAAKVAIPESLLAPYSPAEVPSGANPVPRQN